MDIAQARDRLFSTSFLIGSLQRKGAIKFLAQAPEPEAVEALADALTRDHPEALTIQAALGRLSPSTDAPRIEALWAYLGKAPKARIAGVLAGLGWPAGRRAREGTVKAVLSAAQPGADSAVQAAVAVFVKALPTDDAALTEAAVTAWLRSKSAAIGQAIVGQQRPVSAAAVASLADALCAGHANSDLISACLRQLTWSRDGEKLENLWALLQRQPNAALGALLTQLGWPAGRRAKPAWTRAVLSVAKTGADKAVLAAAAKFAAALDPRDEAGNEEIYAAWQRSQSAELERVISDQDRLPNTPALAAMHALTTGALDRYDRLNDASGRLFVEAFGNAPEPFKQRISRNIQGQQRFLNFYRQANAASTVAPETKIENLIRMGDEDGLFEALPQLRFARALDLCERWATSSGRPSEPKRRAVVDRAVAAWRRLDGFQVEPAPPLPDGLVDIFDYWRGQKPSDADLRKDLAASDPFERSRGLYLGHERGIVDAARLRAATTSEHWPERLIARLTLPETLDSAKGDHVLWVSACAGDAALLGAAVGGTIDDYNRHRRLLEQARGAAATRTRALLEILCAFQGAFVASAATFEEVTEATDGGSTYEDANDVDV
jgi:hypothetical protein